MKIDLIKVLFALLVNDGVDTVNVSAVEMIMDAFRALYNDEEEFLSFFKLPDVSILGLENNQYVESIDMKGNIHINMDKKIANFMSKKYEQIGSMLFDVMSLLSYENDIKNNVNSDVKYVIELPNKDYYLTQSPMRLYEEKLYTDGDIEVDDDIVGVNYIQKHVHVKNATYTIIAVIVNKKVVSCVLRNNVLDTEYISEIINEISNNVEDRFDALKNEKVYRILFS